MMDFIELSPCEWKNFCLVIADVFSEWIYVFPTAKTDATVVAKALLEKILARFGIPEKFILLFCCDFNHTDIDSDLF